MIGNFFYKHHVDFAQPQLCLNILRIGPYNHTRNMLIMSIPDEERKGWFPQGNSRR